ARQRVESRSDGRQPRKLGGISLAVRRSGRPRATAGGHAEMRRLRTAVIAALLITFTGLQPATALAGGRDDRPRHRHEDRWDRHHHKHRKKIKARPRAPRKVHRTVVVHHHKTVHHVTHWDPVRYYRYDPHRYRPRRLHRHDRI